MNTILNVVLLLSFISQTEQNRGNETMTRGWAYQGPNGIDTWCKISKTCCGKQQSPIDIRENTAIKHNASLSSTGFYTAYPLVVENTGHTVTFRLKNNEHASITLYAGDDTAAEYMFHKFHFHWGGPHTLDGSEHRLNGKASRMELHSVHYRSTFGSYKDALEANGTANIAVANFLIEEKPENDTTDDSYYTPIISALSSVQYRGDTADVKTPMRLKDFLPDPTVPLKISFYSYMGSFTTPPCKEGVYRAVFDSKIYLSKSQLSAFFKLYTTKKGEKPAIPMINNHRPIQPLNGRTVMHNIKL